MSLIRSKSISNRSLGDVERTQFIRLHEADCALDEDENGSALDVKLNEITKRLPARAKNRKTSRAKEVSAIA